MFFVCRTLVSRRLRSALAENTATAAKGQPLGRRRPQRGVGSCSRRAVSFADFGDSQTEFGNGQNELSARVVGVSICAGRGSEELQRSGCVASLGLWALVQCRCLCVTANSVMVVVGLGFEQVVCGSDVRWLSTAVLSDVLLYISR